MAIASPAEVYQRTRVRQTAISQTGQTLSLVAPDSTRIALAIGNNGPAVAFIGTDPGTNSLSGIPIPIQGTPTLFYMSQSAGLCSSQWYVFASNGTVVTVLEILIVNPPSEGEDV